MRNVTITPTHGVAAAVDYLGRVAYSVTPERPVSGCYGGEFDQRGRFYPALTATSSIQKEAHRILMASHAKQKFATRDWRDSLTAAFRNLKREARS